MKQQSIFQNVEKKTGVTLWNILKLVNSVKHVNLKDEENVRRLIKQVGVLTNKAVSKEKEDQMVNTIVNEPESLNYHTIGKMLEKN